MGLGKVSAWNAGDTNSIPGSGRSPGGGNGNPLRRILAMENPMDRGTWRATVHGDPKSQTQLSDWTYTHCCYYSSVRQMGRAFWPQCRNAAAKLSAWASQVAQLVKNPPAMQKTLVRFLGWEVPLAKGYATHSSILGLPWWLRWQSIHPQCRDLGSIPRLGRSPGGGHGNPLQYSFLENPHGQRSLVGYSPWGHKESDTTE